ncbi:hypothetical protein [Stieleria marina]|uniref:hypothetical protein n=1 Tax=Stieleria marina TaxID=1930275 RepID=UPI003AF381E4
MPGFSVDKQPTPALRGFGAAEAFDHLMMDLSLVSRARQLINQYDKNRDGILQPNEFSIPVRANLKLIDTNRDRQVSKRELVSASTKQPGLLPPTQSPPNDSAFSATAPTKNRITVRSKRDIFGGRKSYRSLQNPRQHEDMPDFFAEKDTNTDGQIAMSEYASEWNDQVVADFFTWDTNRDGVITPSEAVDARRSKITQPVRIAHRKESKNRKNQSPPRTLRVKPPAKFIAVATAYFRRFDTNRDRELTPKEWSQMRKSPADADYDRNGRLTIGEYAAFLTKEVSAERRKPPDQTTE